MKLKRSIPICVKAQGGFTVMEFLVASFIGLMVIGMTLSTGLLNKRAYKTDLVRTRQNQNLRSAMEILGANAQLAGENLTGTFPAVLVTNGSNGATDELIVRRNTLDEVLKVCTDLSPSISATAVYFATGSVSGCTYSSNTYGFGTWQSSRVAAGGTADAYVYNSSTKNGEFFVHQSEVNTGTTLYLVANDGVWANSYPVGPSAVYRLEQWHFKVVNGTLQLIENQDTANTLNIADGISNFQVQVQMQDNTTKTSFTTSDNWTSIKSIEVSLTGTDTYDGKSMQRSLTKHLFPRNVLSN